MQQLTTFWLTYNVRATAEFLVLHPRPDPTPLLVRCTDCIVFSYSYEIVGSSSSSVCICCVVES